MEQGACPIVRIIQSNRNLRFLKDLFRLFEIVGEENSTAPAFSTSSVTLVAGGNIQIKDSSDPLEFVK
jgi:hypothetical protein